MTNSSFLKKLFLALSVVFLVSCDKDFNEVGADIIDDDIHHNLIGDTIDVVAYDMPTGAVQSNNLFINQLGVYNSDAFGKTVSTYVTQLQFAANTENPKFSSAALIDTVYLYVPYFSKKVATYDKGTTTYKLDSIYGDTTAKLRLNVYQNGYFLRDADPNATSGTQQYYSNDKAMVDVLKVGSRLNTGPLTQNDGFVVTAEEITREATVKGEKKIIERMAPGIYLELDKAVFKQKIIDASGTGNLLNNNVFKNYFRGLYFNIEQVDSKAVMAMPQFAKGVVTIIYKDHPIKTNGEFDTTAEKVRKTLTLNMSGNSINFFENSYKNTFTDAITSSDPVNGDKRLYVKGGDGAMAVINIDQAAIEDLREQNKIKNGKGGVLINEANLSFYIDKTAMKDSKEPLRVYLYDLKNKKPLYDYTTDITSNTVNSKYNKIVHGGIIQYGSDKKGIRYRVRLTNHINNIIKNDSLNVPLGLVVTEDITLVSNASLKTPFTAGAVSVDKVPVSAVVNPLGTVLYGNNVPEEEKDKRLKLEIFYTKPN